MVLGGGSGILRFHFHLSFFLYFFILKNHLLLSLRHINKGIKLKKGIDKAAEVSDKLVEIISCMHFAFTMALLLAYVIIAFMFTWIKKPQD